MKAKEVKEMWKWTWIPGWHKCSVGEEEGQRLSKNGGYSAGCIGIGTTVSVFSGWLVKPLLPRVLTRGIFKNVCLKNIDVKKRTTEDDGKFKESLTKGMRRKNNYPEIGSSKNICPK